MKHITLADKSLLVDDAAADCLLEYARRLGKAEDIDTVSLRAISPDGNTVNAAFLLNASTNILIESTNSEVAPPDNTAAIEYMRGRMERMSNPPNAQTEQVREDPDREFGEA